MLYAGMSAVVIIYVILASLVKTAWTEEFEEKKGEGKKDEWFMMIFVDYGR